MNCVKNKNLEIKENLTGKNQENDTFYKSAVERERERESVCVCVCVCERVCVCVSVGVLKCSSKFQLSTLKPGRQVPVKPM